MDKIQAIAARCSKFSGWNLTVKLGRMGGQPVLEFFDPADASSQSRLIVCIGIGRSLTEVYGRMRHWGIDLEEQLVMRDTLLAEIA